MAQVRRELILGPPGTGKTTRLLREIGDLVDEGFDLREIGFASFTKRAIHEAVTRGGDALNCGEDELPWFKTLHSAFTAACGIKSFVDGKALKEFRELHGYDLGDEAVADASENGRFVLPSGRADDGLRAVVDYARNKLVSIDRAMIETRSRENVKHVRAFDEAYRAWMRTTGRWDYTGVIEEAAARGVSIPVRALIVDEAQDLSPLQARALAASIKRAEVVIVAGDDDQAIFGFQGADHRWIGSLAHAPGWRAEVLSQSWRVPRSVHGLAARIIRNNRLRLEKVYNPRDAEGEVQRNVERVVEMLEQGEGTSAFLGRHRALTEDVAHALYDRAEVAYRVVRGKGPDPYRLTNMATAVKTMAAMMAGEAVARVDLIKLLDFVPSRPKDRPSVLPASFKKNALGKMQESAITPAMAEDLGLGLLVTRARTEGITSQFTLQATAADRRWFGSMWERHRCIPEPKVTLSTIHSTKGGEWDNVFIDPAHFRPVEQALTGQAEESEAERRVAYVAATRAKARLYIARPSAGAKFWFDY